MENFSYYNPVQIVFGKGTIPELKNLMDPSKKVMMIYGKGSIKKNKVYDQVIEALKGFSITEFSGIEANPQYETCLKAVQKIKEEKVDFLLAVGGGSVIDATKFIAAVAHLKEGIDPWDILLTKGENIFSAMPFGAILTLPATGSEMNNGAVISRAEISEKRSFFSNYVFPKFSILDPVATYSLPKRQITNGIIDAYIHAMEQYLTYPANAPLQDRWSESILQTLIEEGPKTLSNPTDYDSRANLMWCVTNALNDIIGSGVPQDWTAHWIGHELTASFGLDHAQTISITYPAVIKHQHKLKREKLIQYGKRVWKIIETDEEKLIDQAIQKTIDFFEQVGNPTTLHAYKLTPKQCDPCIQRIVARGQKLGEHSNIGEKEIREIITLAA